MEELEIIKKESKIVRDLIKEKKYKETEEICKKYPDNGIIQSHYITILIEEGKIEEAKRICNSFLDNTSIILQYNNVRSN